MTFSLPPQRLRIKRKKDEDPVDSIYIQAEQQQKRRRFTDFVFKRLVGPEDGGSAGAAVAKKAPQASRQSRRVRAASLNRGGVPQVRATQPGEEFEDLRTLKPERVGGTPSTAGVELKADAQGAASSDRTLTHTPEDAGRQGPQPAAFAAPARSLRTKKPSMSKLRRFHLERAPSEKFLAAHVAGGVRKRKKKADKIPNIPVLVEKIKSRGLPPEDLSEWTGTTKLELAGRGSQISPADHPRAPDGIRAISQHSDLPKEQANGGGTQSHKDDDLVRDLYSWAQEEHDLQVRGGAAPTKGSADDTSLDGDVLRATDSKMDVDHPDGDVKEDDDQDYVYDTYLRHAAREDTTTDNVDVGAEGVKPENAGVIVIDSHNEEDWDLYLEDGKEGSDSEDGGVDSEDENAESWHGNDYPDDPYSSSDDDGRLDDFEPEDDVEYVEGWDDDDDHGGVRNGFSELYV